jgi:hypothetical protein
MSRRIALEERAVVKQGLLALELAKQEIIASPPSAAIQDV